MSANDIQQHADRLRAAYRDLRPLPPLRDRLPAGDVDLAYRIQEHNTELWLTEGRRLVGRKIGLTSKSVQKQLGVDQPDYGMLFADMAVLDGEEIAAGRLIQPKIEAEIAFVLGDDLTQEQPVLHEVMNAVAYALPALEIVDSRIEGWNIKIVDTVADNASSGLFVLGAEPVAIDQLDLRLAGMVLEKNGEQGSFGAGVACLGNPLHALLWLAQKMVAVGRPLQAGDVVLSGALGPMLPVAPGDRFETRINGLGSVRAAFAAA